jgi:SAM-dependent methyltransferase
VSVLACRGCGNSLRHTFADLGVQPLANSYLDADALDRMELFFPLHVRVCDRCFLVQLPELAAPDEIFDDYAYFSSFSDSWLRHSEAYVDQIVDRLGLGPTSQVVEIASNDGYLLQYMVARGIPSLGIEPAANVAQAAEARGVPTIVDFFGVAAARRLVEQGTQADLIVANNVLAHVPDLHDFVEGLSIALRPGGTITIEFPHVLRLIEDCQFDTIYHEHFSYLSLLALEPVLAAHALGVDDVDLLETHGGSLRLYVRHGAPRDHGRVAELRRAEDAGGLTRLETYTSFGSRIVEVKCELLEFLIDSRRSGARVVGYGAPAKGNTLLNYCGVGPELLEYTVDRNPRKQGRFLPGSRIPIHHPDQLFADRPDHVLILPWNIADEIAEQLAAVRDWGGRLVVPAPSVAVLA